MHHFECAGPDETGSLVSSVLTPVRCSAREQHAAPTAAVDLTRLGDLSIARYVGRGAVHFESAPGPDVLLVTAVREGSHTDTQFGETAAAEPGRSLTLISGWAEAKRDLPESYSSISLWVSHDLLNRQFRALTGHELERPLRFTRQVDLHSAAGATLERLISVVWEDARASGALATTPILRAGIQDLICNTLLTAIEHEARAALEQPAREASLAQVERAEAYIRERFQQPVTIEDLARHCGVSGRAIHAAFHRTRRYTPMQFLKECRLAEARRRLLARNPRDSVTQIALDAGYLHLSRFSVDYLQRWGEMPSITIGRRTRSAQITAREGLSSSATPASLPAE